MIDILEGSALQPLRPITLLPVADEVPDAVKSNWAWLQAKQGSYTADVPPGTILAFANNGTGAVSSLDCGKATGTFAANAQSQLALDLVRCSVIGRVGKPLVQLLDILDAVDTWRFKKGDLVITVAEGDGEIAFGPPPP